MRPAGGALAVGLARCGLRSAPAGAQLVLELGHAAGQRLEGFRDGVREPGVLELGSGDPPSGDGDGASGVADDGGLRRHILDDDGPGADLGVVPDDERSEDLGGGADDHPVADGRMPLAALLSGPAEGHALIDRYVVTDLGRLADDHTHAVVDEQAAADARARMDLDAGQEA